MPCVFVSDCNQMITHRKKQQQNNEIRVISLKTPKFVSEENEKAFEMLGGEKDI